MKGAIACGHPVTASAAEEILLDGGNATDAVIAAALTACVAEPVLASLAGGGFLLSCRAGKPPEIFDFFVQTPSGKPPLSALDFYPMTANFGESAQQFHIGLGTVATPGVAKGLWEICTAQASLPMQRLAEPAIRAAKEGVTINSFQSYIFEVVAPIFLATPESRSSYTSAQGQLLQQGEILRQPALATTLELYAREGSDLFYRGELATQLLESQARGGGQLKAADLENYEVYRREALRHSHRRVQIYTNPPPSSGGTLIVFALALLEALALEPSDFGRQAHVRALTSALILTHRARLDALTTTAVEHGLNKELLARYQREIAPLRQSQRGTTHISVMDSATNVAALTLSNGEGCGHMIPDSGVMLNNMLGEEDINPGGFQQWQPNQRMTSMMAPTVLQWPDGRRVALGSGGSNRIRSALCQVISHLVDFELPLDKAVGAPRLHVEPELLHVEPGFDPDTIDRIADLFATVKQWQNSNLYFGGVHSVEENRAEFTASGDPRRGGVGLSFNGVTRVFDHSP